MNNMIVWVVVALAVLGGGYFLLGNAGVPATLEDGSMMENDAMTPKDNELPTGQVEGEGMMGGDAAMEDDSMMMEEKGTYEDYAPEKLALAKSGRGVLYFHADWCPICRPLDAEFKAASLPGDVHILKVDYDNSSSLKQKYGITYQHTFVQVDEEGTKIAKWGDATTLAQVLARIQ